MPGHTSLRRNRADVNYFALLAEPIERCRLKNLPAEIRNEIFLLAAVESEPIKLGVVAFDDHGAIKAIHDVSFNHYCYCHRCLPFKGRLTGLYLASTCRQFYQEVTPVFYAENTFTLHQVSRSVPTTDHLPFPLARTTKLVIQPTYVKDEGLHINRLVDDTLTLKLSGIRPDTCTCALEGLARSCKGDGCMTKFVNDFLRIDLWDIIRAAALDTPPIWTCKSCKRSFYGDKV